MQEAYQIGGSVQQKRKIRQEVLQGPHSMLSNLTLIVIPQNIKTFLSNHLVLKFILPLF